MKHALTVASEFQLDGDTWTVEAFVGGSIRARSRQGKVMTCAIGALANASDFSFLDKSKNSRTDPTFPDTVSPDALKAAENLLEHLNEMETGYRSGCLGTALDHEPRPQFDVDCTTLSQRIEAKAIELGVTTRSLWGHKAAYEESGIYGLLDGRKLKLSTSKVDQRVIDALHVVVAEIIDQSTLTNQSIFRRVKKHLRIHHGESVTLPSESTFNRLIKRETKNQGLRSSGKARRSISNRPETTYKRFFATRPGELVIIDSTPIDAFAMNPLDFGWIPIQLTLALDLYTRSIVGWRFTPVSTKGVDAVLLLHDIVRPKAMLKGWPESARWNYIGVPENILIEISDRPMEHGIAGIPSLHPESILVDHGKVFVSRAFKDACRRLGINLQLARPYTPTDKSQVERVFLPIRNNFVISLPGYKGPDVYSRGSNPEEQAYYFIDEISEKFAEWVALWWQRRYHEGLDLPNLPNLKMSPNDMYNEGISRAGFVHVVADQNLYFELLPTVWRTIQHYGIEFQGIRYDGDVLNDFRNKESPYTGVHKGKWPIRHDPRDLSKAYFYDHETSEWHELRWVHSEGANRPFNEGVLGYAKELLLSRKGDPGRADELAETLNSILDKLDVTDEDRKIRRMLAANKIHGATAKRDRPQIAAPDDDILPSQMGTLHHSPLTPQEDPHEEPVRRRRGLRNVDDFNEDDDDDLEFN